MIKFNIIMTYYLIPAGGKKMSIKKSTGLVITLMSTLPLIILTIIAFTVTYVKYLDLAKESATKLAEDYSSGFETQLNAQIAEIEGLAQANSIQNIALESYNGVASGTSSAYYTPVSQLLFDTSLYTNNNISYYIYDINGYFVVGSDNKFTGDWEEYMSIPVSSIMRTTILKSSNINKNRGSIDLVTPIIIKNTVIGLVRANISSAYFGNFIPDSGQAFILTEDGSYLFSSEGLSALPELHATASALLSGTEKYGYLSESSTSLENIYGFCEISEYHWLYIVKQDGSAYSRVLKSVPIVLVITLLVITVIAVTISRLQAKKLTDPIIRLKDTMVESTNGNLDIRSDIRSDNELGELSDMFNSMMDTISSNYKALEQSKREIESNQRELKANYEQIERLAYHDGLTGLYNRVGFMKLSSERFHSTGTKYKKHAILFIDLDNFKQVNDTLGHDYGDLLLQSVSDQLTSCLSDTDILSRNGGDEFLIMKSDFKSEEELGKFAEKLVQIVRKPFNLKGEMASVSMSVGVALYPENGSTISEIIKSADIAMYVAKKSGKNSYRFFRPSMAGEVLE